MSWDRKRALQLGRARTRDGRDVFCLQEETILNDHLKTTRTERIILTGVVVLDKRPYQREQLLKTESHYWEGGGLGRHGGDDLVDYPDMEVSKRGRKRPKSMRDIALKRRNADRAISANKGRIL